MGEELRTKRLRLFPVVACDEAAIAALLAHPDVSSCFSEDAQLGRAGLGTAIAESQDPTQPTAMWRMTIPAAETAVGVIALRTPLSEAVRLRAIGWRSLEVIVALDPRWWGRGLAQEAIEAVAEHARGAPVTFALLGCTDVTNTRAISLLERCGFEELGRIPRAVASVVVYERAL